MASGPISERWIDVTVAPERNDGSLADDVSRGLTMAFKQLPPKHLYDARGCDLFDEICELPEYYPTRTERAILTADAGAIVARSGAGDLVELGAGYATKTRVLLDAMRDAGDLTAYTPFDIAEAAVRPTAEAILDEYPELEGIHGVVGDFQTDLGLIRTAPDSPRLFALLGGTIGNFTGEDRRALLQGITAELRPEDHLLLGCDLVKDRAVIESAYNDSAGVTAAFNLNMLSVINRELDGNFPLDNFEHVAFFDTEHEWIEMRLRAREACQVNVEAIGLEVGFAAGEEMRTEISAKFTRERLSDDAAAAGLDIAEIYTDPDELFALVLTRPGGTQE